MLSIPPPPTHTHTHTQVVTYPSSSEVTSILSKVTEQPFFLVARQGGTDLTGYKVLLNEWNPSPIEDEYSGPLYSTEQFWHVQFPADSEQIVSIESKRANGEIYAIIKDYM